MAWPTNLSDPLLLSWTKSSDPLNMEIPPGGHVGGCMGDAWGFITDISTQMDEVKYSYLLFPPNTLLGCGELAWPQLFCPCMMLCIPAVTLE